MADVLLVDDDPHQRALAALVLEAAGHAVREAADGESALREVVARPPDLVVCDVVMPGLNGYQFVAALRDKPSVRGTPVILLTSLAERAQVRVGMNAGADDYLAKPFQPDELRDAVTAVLKRRDAQREAASSAVQADVEAALARQREMLASRYETQLVRELNSKWNLQLEAGQEVAFDEAVVVVADLFATVERAAAAHPDPAGLLKQAHEAARDALYLFGAAHLLHHGGDVVAVFPRDTDSALPITRAVRGAFALQARMAGVLGGDRSMAVAIDAGPFALLRLDDPLHGAAGPAAVPGATLQRAQALRALSRDRDWGVAAASPALGHWPHDVPPPTVGETLDAAGTLAVQLRRPGG